MSMPPAWGAMTSGHNILYHYLPNPKRESTHPNWIVSKPSANSHPTPAGHCLQHLGPLFNREIKFTDRSCCIQNCEIKQHYNFETVAKQTHSSQGFCDCDSLHMAVKFGFKRKFSCSLSFYVVYPCLQYQTACSI